MLIMLLAFISCATSQTNKSKTQELPNVLWIISDDLSPDLGSYGNSNVKTPNIDKLADQGMRFTQAFTTAPVCSASRSAFITGMYQTSTGTHQHNTPDKKPLPGDVKTLMNYYRGAGYFTSNTNGNWEKNGKTHFNFKDENLFDGTDWRQRKSGQPFYAQVNLHEPHRRFSRDPKNPIDPDKVILPSYYPDHPLSRRDWADYLESIQILDQRVGKVLERLEEDGLSENTIVVFMGDHGRAHVRDKQFLYDGGIQIPLIIKWLGHLSPGTVNNDLISAIDLVPTFLNFSGIAIPNNMQGQAFLGNENLKKRDFIVAARDRCDETFDRIRCVRTKKFKYIRNFYPDLPYKQDNLYKKNNYPVTALLDVLYAEGNLTPVQARFMASNRPFEELYDLENDPYETQNLVGEEKHNVNLKTLRSILDNWIIETKDLGEIPENRNIATEQYQDRNLPHYAPLMEVRGFTIETTPNEYLKFWEKRLLTPMSAQAYNKIVQDEEKAWKLKKAEQSN